MHHGSLQGTSEYRLDKPWQRPKSREMINPINGNAITFVALGHGPGNAGERLRLLQQGVASFTAALLA